mgnify:CR=1 FL=1
MRMQTWIVRTGVTLCVAMAGTLPVRGEGSAIDAQFAGLLAAWQQENAGDGKAPHNGAMFPHAGDAGPFDRALSA